jgi:hypothetical protein
VATTPEPSPAPVPTLAQDTAPAVKELPPQQESRKSKKEKEPLGEFPATKPPSSGLIPAMIVLFILFLAGLGVVFYVKQTGSLVQPPPLQPATVDTVAKEAAYIKSGWRHFFDWWKEHRGIASRDGIEEALCALMFNAMGYLYEILRNKEARR